MALNTALKIKIIAKECPRREGTDAAKNWALYKNGMSVEKYLEVKPYSGTGFINTDVKRGHIQLVK